MKRAILIIAFLLFVAFMALLVVEVSKPKPFNWEPSYQSFDKDPYGAYVLFSQLQSFFPNQKVKRLTDDDLKSYYNDGSTFADLYAEEDYIEDDTSYYETESFDTIDYESEDYYYLDSLDTAYQDSVEEVEYNYPSPDFFLRDLEASQVERFNLFVINDYLNFPEADARVILQHVYQGNHALITSNELNGPLAEYLQLEVELNDSTDETENQKRFTVSIKDQFIQLKPFKAFSRITHYPANAEIIAKNELGDILGVRIKVGKGSFSYFSMPISFTNFYLLKDNAAVAEAVLLNLPNRATYWTNYFQGRAAYNDQRSILDFIHAQPALTWAFYTLIISVLLYLSFQLRREQRAIPIIQAPENISLKFTETISNLYLMNSSHKEMLIKKMSLFLEQVRVKYHLDTNVIDERFIHHLATKANVKETLVKLIFERYNKLIKAAHIDDDDFLSFSNLLQNFKHHKS